jgi:hypothetical protein
MSLNNLARRLSGLGRREEALAAADEAVRLYRALAAARPDAFTPDLARSLSVLGDVLEALDRIPEALPTTKKRFVCSRHTSFGSLRPSPERLHPMRGTIYGAVSWPAGTPILRCSGR